MKSYFFVLLKTGTNKTTDKELINASFRGHLDNINRLVVEGKLTVAGTMERLVTSNLNWELLQADNLEKC
jgi:hypothetical protein